MHFLGEGWALQVHHSAANKNYVRHVLLDIPGVRFIQRSEDFITVEHYNRLLKSPEFWKSLSASKVLIFQSDSLILSNDIQKYLHYDYIGAPWSNANEAISQLLAKHAGQGMELAGGNGGFSVRNVNLMQEIATSYGATSPDSENEDVFFSHMIHETDKAVLPTRETAYRFCREVDLKEYPLITEHASLHVAWYYCPHAMHEASPKQCNVFKPLRKYVAKRYGM